MMKRALVLLVALLAGLSIGRQASAQSVSELIQRGELVVGIDLTNAPWGFLDQNQQPAGFDPALAKLVADALGVELRIERVTGPTRIPFLQSGRADVIISTLSMTTERAKQVWFSIPYAPNPLVLAAPAATPYKQYSDLVAGTRIAVPRGSPQDQAVTENAPQATIMRFDDDASVQQALITGQADLIGTGGMVPPTLNKMDPGKNYETKIVLRELYMAMAVRPGSSDFLQWLNTFIFLQKQNGVLEKLSQQYIGVSVGDLPVF